MGTTRSGLGALSAEDISQDIRALGVVYHGYATAIADNVIDGETVAEMGIEEVLDGLEIENKLHRGKLKARLKSRRANCGGGTDAAPPVLLPRELRGWMVPWSEIEEGPQLGHGSFGIVLQVQCRGHLMQEDHNHHQQRVREGHGDVAEGNQVAGGGPPRQCDSPDGRVRRAPPPVCLARACPARKPAAGAR